MQAPISILIRNRLHAGTRKLVGEVLVSSLSTVLAMVVLSNLTKPAPPFSRLDGPISSAVRGSTAGETSDASADFLERVALSHVASLRAPSPDAATVVGTNELPTGAAIPLRLLFRRDAPPRHKTTLVPARSASPSTSTSRKVRRRRSRRRRQARAPSRPRPSRQSGLIRSNTGPASSPVSGISSPLRTNAWSRAWDLSAMR